MNSASVRRLSRVVLLFAVAPIGCGLFSDVDALLPTAGGPAGPARLTTLRPGLFLFAAELNGQAATVLVDTGTPFGLASRDTLRRFNLPPSGLNPFLGANQSSDACAGDLNFGLLLHAASRFKLGTFEFADVPFLVLERFPIELVELGVDVVIGASVMAQLDWEISDDGRTMTLYAGGTLTRPDTAADLAAVDLNLPLLRVRIGTFVVRGRFSDDDDAPVVPLILDTGYSGALGATNFVAALGGLDDPSLPTATLPIVSWSSICLSRSVINPLSSVGGKEFRDLQVDLLPSGDSYITGFFGLIGARMLGAHHTRCSPRGGWIDFEDTPTTAARLAVRPGDYGFITTRDDAGQLLVRLVLPDSPADRAGLLAGDIITQINGASPVGLSSFELIALEPNVGDVLTLVVERAQSPQTISVTAESGFSAPAMRLVPVASAAGR